MRHPLPARLLAGLVSGLLAGCAGGPELMTMHGRADATFASFDVCHGYGCFQRSPTGLDGDETARILEAFAPPPPDAESERARIGAAIGLFERLVGAKIGTSVDRGGADPMGGTRQLDCIDEAVNTTSYLNLLQAAGVLRFHRVGLPAHRGLEIGRWPHNTATIRESAAPERAFAVDSWYRPNGVEPDIVPLAAWTRGWRPDDL